MAATVFPPVKRGKTKYGPEKDEFQLSRFVSAQTKGGRHGSNVCPPGWYASRYAVASKLLRGKDEYAAKKDKFQLLGFVSAK